MKDTGLISSIGNDTYTKKDITNYIMKFLRNSLELEEL